MEAEKSLDAVALRCRALDGRRRSSTIAACWVRQVILRKRLTANSGRIKLVEILKTEEHHLTLGRLSEAGSYTR